MRSVANEIQVAPDLPPVGQESKRNSSLPVLQSDNAALHIIFLSRITPKKNLDFLLEALCSVQSAITLSIYGPLCEPDYWQRCQSLMASLPANISAEYAGEVHPSKVLEVFSAFDVFALPTRGENYGHVVLESLTAGTPVLISDQTPWQSSADGGLQVMPLGDPRQWALTIDRLAKMSRKERLGLRAAALNYASHYLERSNVVEQNRALFLKALQSYSV
jgi:glycosyltransferase involved in cell wall biosynthesis